MREYDYDAVVRYENHYERQSYDGTMATESYVSTVQIFPSGSTTDEQYLSVQVYQITIDDFPNMLHIFYGDLYRLSLFRQPTVHRWLFQKTMAFPTD